MGKWKILYMPGSLLLPLRSLCTAGGPASENFWDGDADVVAFRVTESGDLGALVAARTFGRAWQLVGAQRKGRGQRSTTSPIARMSGRGSHFSPERSDEGSQHFYRL